ncbi:MAG: hypothetical protein HYX37_14665 [Rhizobiales bacterium]|nr:hypothetical protein [Hyphomicrobiales bacterium]
MNKNAMERVLVFGDDMRIFLAVARSLGRAGKEVHAAPFNWHAPALKSKYIHAVHRLPRYSDDPNAWRTAMQELLRSASFDLVIPCCDDRSILPFHMHREDFSAYRVAIPNPMSMDFLFDKQATRELATRLGIPVVPGLRLSEEDNAPDLAARYGLPLVIKPRRSYWPDRLDGWGKVFIVESEHELTRILAELQDRPRYLAEGYFKGVGVGVSVLADNGQIRHVFQHRRLREGWGGSSSYRISEVINPGLYSACEEICRHTNLTGVCMFEFRFNRQTQKWVLLETNARFWGSLPLPLSLGLDFPLYLYDLLVHRRHHAPVQYTCGVRSRNVVLDGLNLVESLGRLHWNEIGAWLVESGRFLMQPVGWLTGRERSDSFVLDDMRPGFAECAMLLTSMRQKLVRSRHAQLARRRSEQVA